MKWWLHVACDFHWTISNEDYWVLKMLFIDARRGNTFFSQWFLVSWSLPQRLISLDLSKINYLRVLTKCYRLRFYDIAVLVQAWNGEHNIYCVQPVIFIEGELVKSLIQISSLVQELLYLQSITKGDKRILQSCTKPLGNNFYTEFLSIDWALQCM